jgi:serine/threonine protein kinase/tetratricopeptide (TPR) repeat protein
MALARMKRFTLRRRLGEGGMGVVHEAFDEERRTSVALKTLNRFDASALARFKREFRALQGLSHPNLVALDELFFEDGEWFFTMELLDGVDLVAHVRGGESAAGLRSTIRESAGKLATRGPPGEAPPPAPSGSFDEAKLRDGLRQLLEGLVVLHAAEKVHRDIKPSNVLVTRAGRVVLLDFGLVTESSASATETGLSVVGTPEYMAPEQAASREPGPAADLYSVGAMLYELLTGVVPFRGTAIQVMLDKQKREPPPPRSLVPDVASDLDALCVSLLRSDPAQRPTAVDVLRALSTSSLSRPPAAARTTSDSSSFVGRRRELAQLDELSAERAGGRLAAALVIGESGIGKSRLVRRFTSQLLGNHPETLLLEGRCYEREAVPYKTLDGIMDALARRLARMPQAQSSALLPLHCAVLGQLFPVLLRVPLVAKEHAKLSTRLPPNELRQRGFLTLRDLFARVATRIPTVIVIDDLQWADDDGLSALAEILRPPDSPPLLLVGTVRVAKKDPSGQGGPDDRDERLGRLRAAIPGEVREITLAALDREDARDLAAALLRVDAPDADAQAIAAEAGGHPLFLEELARHVALGGAAVDVKLDDAIWTRVMQLDPTARALAEVAAVASKPLPQEVVAAAARIEPTELNRAVSKLRVANIVRTGGARWADAIEPYHDRVRESVLAQLDPERRRALHEALAITLEAGQYADPETLATHWRGAGNVAHATKYAALAGDQAVATFAFDRAAQWYEQALAVVPVGHAGRRELRVKLGEALANAGRGALAAEHFETAAAESPPAEALELRRRVADQLLRSGHFDRGVEASRTVLASIGMRMPHTRLGTMLAILFYRAVLRLRGLRFRARDASQITAQELTRIDTCWSIGSALGYADTFRGFVFTTRALLLALATGDLDRVARTLGGETSIVSTAGGKSWRKTERLIAITRELAERSGTTQARAWATTGAGIAFYCNGRFPEAAEHLGNTLAMLEEGSTGLVFERVTARMYLIFTMAYQGRWRDLRRLQREGLRDALARGDVYATVIMRLGNANLAWLAADRPDVAAAQAHDATQEWSKSGFHLEHAYSLIARTHIALYEGDAAAAYASADEYVRRLDGALLRRIQPTRLRAFQLRAMATLAMLEAGLGDRRTLTAGAERDARAIERERMPWMLPFATVVRAALSLRSGARDEAVQALGRAARDFDAADMRGYGAAARDRAARLRGDGTTIEQVASLFRADDVIAPERMISMLVPGLRTG